MGRLGIDDNGLKGFKEYYIVAFIYKVPIASQLLLLIGIISLIRCRYRVNFWQNEAFLIVPSLLFIIFFSFSTTQLGIRYILMIFPFLFVFSGRVLRSSRVLTVKHRIFVTFLVTYLLISNLSYFPHYLSYFNELLIDRKMGYTILADSNLDWGQNKNYLKDYLTKNPEIIYVPSSTWLRNNPPETKLPTKIVISANRLVGIAGDPKTYQWIRDNLKPVDHVAYSYLVFKIQPQDLPRK